MPFSSICDTLQTISRGILLSSPPCRTPACPLTSLFSHPSVTMKFNAALSSALFAASAVIAAPTSTLEVEASRVDSALEKRATTFCGNWGSQTAGPYTFYHNNWGAGAASSGSQCTTFNDLQSNTASWSTSWSWSGGQGSVKSYSNVALEKVNRQLSSISTINSIWNWGYVIRLLVVDEALYPEQDTKRLTITRVR